MTDMERVLTLPVSDRSFSSWEDQGRSWTVRLRRHLDAPPLRPVQGAALAELERQRLIPQRGAFFPLGVGYGKFLIGELAGAALDARSPLLLIPPEMQKQTHKERGIWTKHYRYTPPQTLSHTMLSQPHATDLLSRLAPDLIIIDEAHAFRYASSARTKRLIRYVVANPDCRVVVMSGSFTSKAITEYLHLLELTLRDGAPVPLEPDVAAIWSAVLDAEGTPDHRARSALDPLVAWASATNPSALVPPACVQEAAPDPSVRYRLAFSLRKSTTPGVITSDDSAFTEPLVLTQRKADVPPVIEEALDDLRKSWVLPDGVEIVDALGFHRACAQISSGWFGRWIWPERACLVCDGAGGSCQRCNGSGRVAGPDEEWLSVRRTWAAAERTFIEYHSRQGLDSPALVQAAVQKVASGKEVWGVGPALVKAWEDWVGIRGRYRRSDGVYAPPSIAVWLDDGDFLVQDAVAWRDAVPRGIVWYRAPEVGSMLAQYGFDVYGAGSSEPEASVNHPALSINVHGRGKNLQPWSNQYVLEPSGSAQEWEQLLGRTHRPGQKAATVWCAVAGHNWWLRAQMSRASAFSRYIESTEGQQQKLNLAEKRF
jgi:hypothetical protein